jgi:hypothetical protein
VAHEKVIDSLARFVGGYGAHLHRTFWSVQADGFGEGTIHNKDLR